CLSSYSLYCKLFTDLAIPGWSSHILSASFFAALNALGISMLGEYVVRIYDQVRGRPLYLIDRTVNLKKDGVIDRTIADRSASATSAMDLESLDPLNLDTQWDDAYQHL